MKRYSWRRSLLSQRKTWYRGQSGAVKSHLTKLLRSSCRITINVARFAARNASRHQQARQCRFPRIEKRRRRRRAPPRRGAQPSGRTSIGLLTTREVDRTSDCWMREQTERTLIYPVETDLGKRSYKVEKEASKFIRCLSDHNLGRASSAKVQRNWLSMM